MHITKATFSIRSQSLLTSLVQSLQCRVKSATGITTTQGFKKVFTLFHNTLRFHGGLKLKWPWE